MYSNVQSAACCLQARPFLETPSPLFWTGEDLLCWDDLSLAFENFPIVSLSLVSSEGHSKFFTLHLTAQVSVFDAVLNAARNAHLLQRIYLSAF